MEIKFDDENEEKRLDLDFEKIDRLLKNPVVQKIVDNLFQKSAMQESGLPVQKSVSEDEIYNKILTVLKYISSQKEGITVEELTKVMEKERGKIIQLFKNF